MGKGESGIGTVFRAWFARIASVLTVAQLVALAATFCSGSASAAVTYLDSRQARNGSTTTLSILSRYGSATAPIWQNGDIVVAHIYIGSTKAETITPPAGWTFLRADSNSNSQYWIFYRAIATGFFRLVQSEIDALERCFDPLSLRQRKARADADRRA